MQLDKVPFDMIASGIKVYELRLYDEKRRKLAVGDTIVFTDRANLVRKMEVAVLSLALFRSFEELYWVLPLDKCGYTKETIASASPEDMSAYYSKDEEKKYGVVAIGVSVSDERY